MKLIDIAQLTILIGLGLFDVYRLIVKKKTISQKVHAWFGKVGDGIILVSVLVGMWWIGGPSWFIPVMWGTLLGHLFWHEN
jgi:hypothetical protein